MKNPWQEIELSDYENHMKLESVYQLQTLSSIMREQLYEHSVRTAMILGVAGGNGLEHVESSSFDRIYGVDLNRSYLDECKRRFRSISDIFEPICVDLTSSDIELPHSELVIANLLVEYIGYKSFCDTLLKINAKYVSCVIQINTDESFVSDSPYIHVFDRLDEVHHQMDDKVMDSMMSDIGYDMVLKREYPLPNGKMLLRVDYVKKHS